MKVLVFDTETTGLPTEKNASIMDTEKWPYILQLSYVVYDTDENHILECVDDIIKINSEKIKISAETTAIHGITNEICNEKGVPIQDALKRFNEIYDSMFSKLSNDFKIDQEELVKTAMGWIALAEFDFYFVLIRQFKISSFGVVPGLPGGFG